MIALLLESSIRAALIAAAVAIVLSSLRIVTPRARHAAWCGVLAAMLLLPVYLVWGPKANIPAMSPVAETTTFDYWIPISTDDAKPIKPVVTSQPAPPIPEPHRPARPNLVLAAYLAIAVYFLLRLILGTLQAASLLKRASPEEGFFSSNQCACPVTIGWLRPRVILPSSWRDWTQDELNAVLAHEREHARRRDPLVQWIAALNRCVFWFHPLAWWLDRRLALLAEHACDDAAIARGHDKHDYSEYLLHQARAIQLARARLTIRGVAMGNGSISKRIVRILETPPVPGPSRPKAIAGAALCTTIIAAFSACHLDRMERPAAGQPTMNELLHRQADSSRQQQEKEKALRAAAAALTPDQAQTLVAKLKQSPEDQEAYRTLVLHYELKKNLHDLNALRLWYIEHDPGGKIWTGNIDPRLDRDAYDRGKVLWLANLKRPGASVELYRRAADFLEGDDRMLAESVLQSGQKAYPKDKVWARALGKHYAQALLGSGEPLTAFNVFRSVNEHEAQSPYARTVRARLADSTDATLLLSTASNLMMWGQRYPASGKNPGFDPTELVRTYLDRALSIEPNSEEASILKSYLAEWERGRRATQLMKMPPAESASVNDSDRMLLTLMKMRMAWMQQKLGDAESKATELVKLAAQHPGDSLVGDALFEANIVQGKTALRRGDRRAAVRFLLAAADVPPSNSSRRGQFEMNLPRALIDRGERTGVADFLERMAPKTVRSEQFRDWAAQIRKGINPDLIPTRSTQGCSQDPC